jgi:hypothetical protein
MDAPRAFLTAPYLASMTPERRLAHAINERSASTPRTLSSSKAHGAGCGCCAAKPLRPSGKRARPAKRAETKGFPERRPWMLSH